jgi:hypothetical protein
MEARIASAIAGERPLDFDHDALAVFAYQFERNLPYRRYCLLRGRTPRTVQHWRDIPAVSTAAFRVVDLACGAAERVFLTSGTTRGRAARGRHVVPRLSLYRTAALAQFAAYVATDGMRAPVLALTPPPALCPESSLVQMIEWIRETYGTGDDAYFIGQGGLETEALRERLEAVARAGTPVFLIGIKAAFEEVFAHWQATGRQSRLPYGTLIVDTGGNKRTAHLGPRSRSLSRLGFLSACWRFLNVPAYHCINEYGMTELCSQFYDNVLRERVAGRMTTRYKVGPPWTRTIVVDPETLEEVPAGTAGLLRHVDLANCGSVLAVQTEDIGVAIQTGFEIRGRLSGTEPRGCALLLEDPNADTVAPSSRAHGRSGSD